MTTVWPQSRGAVVVNRQTVNQTPNIIQHHSTDSSCEICETVDDWCSPDDPSRRLWLFPAACKDLRLGGTWAQKYMKYHHSPPAPPFMLWSCALNISELLRALESFQLDFNKSLKTPLFNLGLDPSWASPITPRMLSLFLYCVLHLGTYLGTRSAEERKYVHHLAEQFGLRHESVGQAKLRSHEANRREELLWHRCIEMQFLMADLWHCGMLMA